MELDQLIQCPHMDHSVIITLLVPTRCALFFIPIDKASSSNVMQYTSLLNHICSHSSHVYALNITNVRM